MNKSKSGHLEARSALFTNSNLISEMTEAKFTESSSEVSQKLAIGVQKIVCHLGYGWAIEFNLFSKCRDSFKSLGEELSGTMHASISDLKKVSEQREVIRSNATIILKPS